MLKKIWIIFVRDVKVNSRDVISLILLVFPLLFAVGINLIVPGINDTTVNVAMIENEDPGRAAFFDQFANVELFRDTAAVEARVSRRDSVFGVVRENGETVVVAQGNESQSLLDYTKLINVLYDSGAELGDARSEIVDFGRSVPPIKKIMVNGMLLFISAIAGMLIAINILEEKTDKTVAAINVSPVPRGGFILGKSLTGMMFALVISAVCIVITGFYDINAGQAALVIFATTILSLVIGFSQGISSDDVMEAAGSVKLMFLPMAASVIGYELLSEKWQICLYWSPFYWAYRAYDLILSGGAAWPQLLLYVVNILVICGVVTAVLAPHIRKGLQ